MTKPGSNEHLVARHSFGRRTAMLTAGASGLLSIPKLATAADRTLRLGHMWPATSVWGKGAQRFADLVTEKSASRLAVRVYPDGQLGGERDMEEGLGVGNLDCTFG